MIKFIILYKIRKNPENFRERGNNPPPSPPKKTTTKQNNNNLKKGQKEILKLLYKYSI